MGEIYNIQKKREQKTQKNVIQKKEEFFNLSEKEKYNYTTIKEIFETFPKDLDFLIEIYDEIIEHTKEMWTLEFSIRLLDLLNNIYPKLSTLNTTSEEQKNRLLKKYESEIIKVVSDITWKTNYMKKEMNLIMMENSTLTCGKGFVFIEYTFPYSEKIMNYFAKEFLSQIINPLEIEIMLHKNYPSYENFEIMHPNLKKYILDYIALQDTTLSYYIMKHPKMLEEMLEIFKAIQKNWEYWEAQRNAKNKITIVNFQKKMKTLDMRKLQNQE